MNVYLTAVLRHLTPLGYELQNQKLLNQHYYFTICCDSLFELFDVISLVMEIRKKWSFYYRFFFDSFWFFILDLRVLFLLFDVNEQKTYRGIRQMERVRWIVYKRKKYIVLSASPSFYLQGLKSYHELKTAER